MREIARKILRQFLGKTQEALKAERTNPNEIKAWYPGAGIIGNDRIVFNIKENSYHLIVKINFDYQLVWIRFVGTHSGYDKVNANFPFFNVLT